MPVERARGARLPSRRLAGTCLVVGLLVLAPVVAHRADAPPRPPFEVGAIEPADIEVIDLGDAGVTVQVTNRGAIAVAPVCTVSASDAVGSHRGTGTFTLRQPLEPAQTTQFTAKVRIAGQAAESVTRASASCR